MMYKSVHVNYLDRAELEYELSVRGSRDLAGMRMEYMRKILRKKLKKERSGSLKMPSATGDREEVEACREKLEKIQGLLNLLALPNEGTDVEKLKKRLEVLLYHVYQRIERISDEHETDKGGFSQRIKELIKRFEEISHRPLQGNSSELENNSSSSSEDSTNKEDNIPNGAIKKVPHAENLPSDSEENAKAVSHCQSKNSLDNFEKENSDPLTNKLKLKKKSKKINFQTLSSSETETSEDDQRSRRKSKRKKNKRKSKKNKHRRRRSTSTSSTSTSSSVEDRTRKFKLQATPVRFWNLKFSGDDNTSVGAFLADVEDRRVANHMSYRDLFQASGELLTGSALTVYRSSRGRIKDWQGLEKKLRCAFQDPDYDRRLLREIENRKQGSEESAIVYIAKMRSLFQRLAKPKSEEEMLEIIEENVLPEYQSALSLQNYHTLEDLENILRCLEKGRLRAQRYDAKPTKTLLEPDLAYKPRLKKEGIKISTMKPSTFVEDKRKFLPKHSTKCWNCKELGHRHADCTKPKSLFCYGCGKSGTTKPKCSECKSKGKTEGNFTAERLPSGPRSAMTEKESS